MYSVNIDAVINVSTDPFQCSLLSSEGHEVMLVAYHHDLKKCFKCGSDIGKNYLAKFPTVMQEFVKFCEGTIIAK